MPNLKTNSFRVHVTEQLHESLFEPNGTKYYMFAGRPEAWVNEASPPTPTDSPVESTFNLYDTMLFGKVVSNTDVSFMVPRHDWVANTVYAKYSDSDALLHEEEYYVVVNASTQYHIFKCLDNAGGAPSTVQPNRSDTSEDDDFYQTSDGYQWKYLYSVSASQFQRFATPTWMPVVENANTTANAVAGAIDVIEIVNPGTQYNSYANGFFTEIAVGGDTTIFGIDVNSSANTDFYRACALKIVDGQGKGQQREIAEYTVQGGFKRVILTDSFVNLPNESSKYEITPNVIVAGDGSDCVARAIVNPSSNTIASIEITNRGTGYTYATAEAIGNTGLVISGNVITANTAQLRPIMGPTGGHGFNINQELGAVALGFSVTFANTEQDTIPANGKFRQIGLIKDPLFANVEFTVANTVGVFADGERVSCDTNAYLEGEVSYFSEPSSVLRITEATAGWTANTVVRGATSNAVATIASYRISGAAKSFTTFDQRVRLDTTFNGTPAFVQGETVRQEVTDATAKVQYSNTTFTAVTSVRGTLNITNVDSGQVLTGEMGVANVNAIVAGDLLKASGEALYIENIQPVTRSSELSETIKFIIRF